MTNFTSKLRAGAGISVVVLLSACGGSSTSGGGVAGLAGFANAPSIQEAERLVDLAESDFERLIGEGEECTKAADTCMPGTKFEAIPETGTATYTGPGAVSIFERTVVRDADGNVTLTEDTEVVGMLGTSRITYDFAADTFSGTIEDMFAVDGKTLNTDLVAGEVVISQGTQANPKRPTLLNARATGTLEAFGDEYEIDVDLEGLLRGTNTNAEVDIPVRALTLEGHDGKVAGSDLLVDVATVGDKAARTYGAYVGRDE